MHATRRRLQVVDVWTTLKRFRRTPDPATPPALRWDDRWRVTGGAGVRVGLLDSACNPRLPDLRSARLEQRDFTGGTSAAVSDSDHGSYSATLLAGRGMRLAGLVPEAEILFAAVVGSDGLARPAVVAHAIDWLIDRGVRIVTLPLGTTRNDDRIERALTRGGHLGVLFFAAAGNLHPSPVLFPARHVHAIAVGASDARGRLLPECCRLPRLDLTAPGHQIGAVTRGRTIRRRDGTSVACVVAAGIATLALAAGALPLAGREHALAVLGASRPDAPPLESSPRSLVPSTPTQGELQ